MLSHRSHQPEWMDLGSAHYSSEEYRDCLYQLSRVGRLLGGDKATFRAIDQLPEPPQSILDVGCGGGLFTLRLAERYPNACVCGVDISKDAISFALERLQECRQHPSKVQFLHATSPHLDELEDSFDVVTATLVCHHLSDHEMISFLRESCRIAKKAVIINDLHRHSCAFFGFGAVAPILFRNRLLWHDGLLSIRRSFTRRDWTLLLHAAGIDERSYRITWHWAFRWIVQIDPSKTPV